MCKKIQYEDFDIALKEMQILNRMPKFNLKRIYMCPFCHTWHLTSKDKIWK